MPAVRSRVNLLPNFLPQAFIPTSPVTLPGGAGNFSPAVCRQPHPVGFTGASAKSRVAPAMALATVVWRDVFFDRRA
jgi:hypothetical protein